MGLAIRTNNILITSRDDPDNILYSSNAMLTLEDVENPDLVLGVGLPDQQHMARLSSKVGAQMRDIGRDFGGGHKEQDTTIEGLSFNPYGMTLSLCREVFKEACNATDFYQYACGNLLLSTKMVIWKKSF